MKQPMAQPMMILTCLAMTQPMAIITCLGMKQQMTQQMTILTRLAMTQPIFTCLGFFKFPWGFPTFTPPPCFFPPFFRPEGFNFNAA